MSTATRWWSLVIGATAVVVLGAVLLTEDGWRVPAVAGVLVGYVAYWFADGRRAGEGDPRSIVLTVVTIAVAAGLTAIAPVGAFFQFVAYPVVWSFSRDVRRAVVANLVLVVAVAGGFLVSLGTTPDALLQTVITQGISLAFSLAMGLWISRIAAESERRRALLEQLSAARDELAALHRDAGVTAERERLARELHDTIAQSLAGLVLLGQRARREFAGGTLTDETLELLESGARDALTETRALVAAGARIEPGRGVVETVERLLARFERETGVRVALDARVEHPLDRDAEVVLVRCVQEALANVRKHAGASEVRVDLVVDADRARVKIADNGVGFDPDTIQEGFGLPGLRDRLALAGGDIRLDSGADGTALEATLPVGAAA